MQKHNVTRFQGIFKEILELHKQEGLGDRSPPAGSRGGAPVRRGFGGRSPPEAETHCRLL